MLCTYAYQPKVENALGPFKINLNANILLTSPISNENHVFF